MDCNNEEMSVWAKKRMNELFMVERFKEMGRENDPIFQALVFMGAGSEKLSIGSTILRNYTEFPNEIRNELQQIQQQLTKFQERLQSLNYCRQCKGVIEPLSLSEVEKVCSKCYWSR